MTFWCLLKLNLNAEGREKRIPEESDWRQHHTLHKMTESSRRVQPGLCSTLLESLQLSNVIFFFFFLTQSENWSHEVEAFGLVLAARSVLTGSFSLESFFSDCFLHVGGLSGLWFWRLRVLQMQRSLLVPWKGSLMMCLMVCSSKITQQNEVGRRWAFLPNVALPFVTRSCQNAHQYLDPVRSLSDGSSSCQQQWRRCVSELNHQRAAQHIGYHMNVSLFPQACR